MVDDHEPWRRHIRSLLRRSGGWNVVGQAACGLEAVQNAATLAPDLILLDVELPSLNGLDAARRILAADPGARILFVSSHRSWEIAETAFAIGGRGYVLKSHAAEELLHAMNAVARGSRFISPVLVGCPLNDERARQGTPTHRHEVGFYSQGTFLVEDFARFTEAALNEGQAVIVATLESRRHDLQLRLQASVDLDLAIRQGRYLWVDQADLVSAMMVEGWPDETRFCQNATSSVMQAARASWCNPPRVAVCGEGTYQLLQAGKVEAAIQLEHLWDELAGAFHVDILCCFSMTSPRHHEDLRVFEGICAEHTTVRTR